MRDKNRLRWRDRRDTIPARRHRRRRRRRDVDRHGTYTPIEVDPASAEHGVRSRLIGATLALMLTVLSLIAGGASLISSFAVTFALTVGILSCGVAFSLLLSARHEEEVHELASELEAPDVIEFPEPDDGTDGSLRPGEHGAAEL